MRALIVVILVLLVPELTAGFVDKREKIAHARYQVEVLERLEVLRR